MHEGRWTAQDAFEHLMRDMIAPKLRDLGFRGTGSRVFRYRSGDYGAAVTTQKSRYSTAEEVRFWVHLSAAYLPTSSTYWTAQLHALIPGNTTFTTWAIRADAPAEPVAEHLLSIFVDYGWPAIQAALDSPGYPPDPAMAWPRTFPREPASGSAASQQNRMVRLTGRRGDGLVADLSHPDELVRVGATGEIGAAMPRRRRAVPTLLRNLEHDPSPAVRQQSALALRMLAAEHDVRQALQAAATQDEDHTVRWAARYALRLQSSSRHQ